MYFYFGSNSDLTLGLFTLVSVVSFLLIASIFALSVKVILLLKYIIGYIKKRGEK
jgi:hypothetical protein